MTQGLVSVLSGPQVLMKVVAGNDGMRAQEVGKAIRVFVAMYGQLPTVDEAYSMAAERGFGCVDCLVVMTKDARRFDGDDELSPAYQDTFDQQGFNPRKSDGVSDYSYSINVEHLLEKRHPDPAT